MCRIRFRRPAAHDSPLRLLISGAVLARQPHRAAPTRYICTHVVQPSQPCHRRSRTRGHRRTFPAGTVLHSDDIAQTQGVSRSVVREAIRVLAAMGLVESVRRIGIRVLPPDAGMPTTPPSSAGASRATARVPSCAHSPSCAPRSSRWPPNWPRSTAPKTFSAQLMAVAAQMRTVGRAGDLRPLSRAGHPVSPLGAARLGERDVRRASTSRSAPCSRGRTDLGLMPTRPHETALQWHVDVADAIQGGHPGEGTGRDGVDHAANDRRGRADLG